MKMKGDNIDKAPGKRSPCLLVVEILVSPDTNGKVWLVRESGNIELCDPVSPLPVSPILRTWGQCAADRPALPVPCSIVYKVKMGHPCKVSVNWLIKYNAYMIYLTYDCACTPWNTLQILKWWEFICSNMNESGRHYSGIIKSDKKKPSMFSYEKVKNVDTTEADHRMVITGDWGIGVGATVTLVLRSKAAVREGVHGDPWRWWVCQSTWLCHPRWKQTSQHYWLPNHWVQFFVQNISKLLN